MSAKQWDGHFSIGIIFKKKRIRFINSLLDEGCDTFTIEKHIKVTAIEILERYESLKGITDDEMFKAIGLFCKHRSE